MKIVLDTNVFISGIFFHGAPYDILNAWRHSRIHLVVSPEILNEYRRVTTQLMKTFPGVDPEPVLDLLMMKASMIESPCLPEQVSTDKADDMFLSCALASKTKIVVSGDKALLKTSGYRGIVVISPRNFVNRYLEKKNLTSHCTRPKS